MPCPAAWQAAELGTLCGSTLGAEDQDLAGICLNPTKFLPLGSLPLPSPALSPPTRWVSALAPWGKGINKGSILRGKKEELKEDAILNAEKVFCQADRVPGILRS